MIGTPFVCASFVNRCARGVDQLRRGRPSLGVCVHDAEIACVTAQHRDDGRTPSTKMGEGVRDDRIAERWSSV
jgi:hypothetical protein